MAEPKRLPTLKGKGVSKAPERDSSDEELPDYPEGLAGVQQAYSDIQNIFSDVAREYPEFLKSDDEGDGPGGLPEGCGDQMRSAANVPGPPKDTGVKTRVEGDTGPDLAIPASELKPPPQAAISPRIVLGKRPLSASVGPHSEGLPTQVVLPKTLKSGARPKVSTSDARPESPRVDIVPSGLGMAPKLRPSSGFGSSRLLAMTESEVFHDQFASEFIGRSEKDLDKSIVTKMQDMANASLQLNLPESPGKDGPVHDPTVHVLQNPKASSLKLIYKPPMWPHQEGLYKTLSRLPLLRSLVLDDSKIKWLRDLGSGLSSLTTLSVMRCGLKSLDGLSGLGNLEFLFAGDNVITDPSPISACTNIKFVDLSENQISETSGFAFLRGCHALTQMKLMENPVSKLRKFHSEMRALIPSLRDLRPRILEIHGPEVFDLYDLPEEEEFQWPRSRQSGTEFGRSSRGMDASQSDDEISDLGRLTTDEGRRLLNVYNPGLSGYKRRALKSVPVTVDEMDAFLEELESTGSSTVNLPMADRLGEMDGFMVPGELKQSQNPLARISTVPRLGTSIPKAQRGKGGRAKTAVHFPQQ